MGAWHSDRHGFGGHRDHFELRQSWRSTDGLLAATEGRSPLMVD
jgi:hypothetical protein